MRTNGARDYSNVRNGGTSSLVSGIELKWDIIFIPWKWILLIGTKVHRRKVFITFQPSPILIVNSKKKIPWPTMINLNNQRSSQWNPPKSLNKSQFLFFPIKHFRKIPSDRKSRYLLANGHEELNSTRSVMMRENYDIATKKVSLVIPLCSLWCALVVKMTNSQSRT